MADDDRAALFTPGAGVHGLPSATVEAVVSGALRADAVVLGLPFDGGVAGVPGQRHGPEILRHHSPSLDWLVDGSGCLSGVFDPVTRRAVLPGRSVFDVGDLGAIP